MRKHNRIVCLILCMALLICLLGACSTTDSVSEATSEEPAISNEPEVGEEAPVNEDAQEPQAEASEEAQPTSLYPIVTEPVTLSYFIGFDSSWGEYLDSWETHPAFMKAEEVTGVEIEFNSVSSTAYSEQFNLMIASQDYRDMIEGFGTNYTSGYDHAVEDDIIIDLAGLMDTCAPNYSALLDQYPDTKKETTTDNGVVGSLYNLKMPSTGPMLGGFTRKDWLDKLGLDTPSTYDDYYEMLTLFKSEMGATSPLFISSSGIPSNDWLATGYGVCLGGSQTGPWYQEDGVVKFGYLEDGFTDYVTMMNKWYSEGLISSDFTSVDDTMFSADATAAIVDGHAGVWYSFYRQDDSWGNKSSDPDFECTAITDAVLEEDSIIPFGNSASIVDRAGVSISTSCDEPEIALKWLDFWYSDQGVLLANYGVEGISYTMEDDGPHLTELITDNENGAPQSAMMYAYTLQQASYYDTARTQKLNLGDRDVWGSNRSSDNDYPQNTTLTTDEGDVYYVTYSDIETYISEILCKFIIGDEPLSNIENFQQTLYDMGIEDCIAIKQDALDRYNQR